MLVLKLKRGNELKERKTKVKAKVWKDVDKVIKSTIEIKEEYKEIKKIMEEAPNGVNIKPKSKFRKDTRIEKY